MEQIKSLLEDQRKAFEDFKRANDAELAEIKAKGHADPLLSEKVDKANAEISRLEEELKAVSLKSTRIGAPGAMSEKDQLKAEHKAAFDGFMRKGRDAGLADLQMKAMNVTTEADGGYAVPEEIDRSILALMQVASPMRSVCNVITVGTPDYKKLVGLHGATAGWVDEDDARTATTTPQLGQVAAVMGEIYANAYATQTLLDDAFFNAEQWLIGELVEKFALEEGTAFTTGNGTKKPKGFLAYTQASTADGTRAFGSVQYIATGTSGAFKTASASVNQNDDLITVIHALKAPLRSGAAFMMNTSTLAAVRKWKEYSTGAYIWQPSMQAGQPSLLNGFPVTENEDMPSIGSGTVPIAFGNWKRAYTIVDRIGIRTLRDPYTQTPYIRFYMTKRVGGMLVDSEAVKLLKLAAS